MYEKIENAAGIVRTQLKRLTDALETLSPGNATARSLKVKAWLLSKHPALTSTRVVIDDEWQDTFDFDVVQLLQMQNDIAALVVDCEHFLTGWYGDDALHARLVSSTIVPAFLDLVEAHRSNA